MRDFGKTTSIQAVSNWSSSFSKRVLACYEGFFFWAATYLVAYWLTHTESVKKETRVRLYMGLPVSSSVQPTFGGISGSTCCRLLC